MIDFLMNLWESSGTTSQAIIPLLTQGLSFATDLRSGNQAREKELVGLNAQLGFAGQDLSEGQAALKNLEQGNLRFAPKEQKVSGKAYEAYDIAQSRAVEDASQQSQDAFLATMAANNGGGSEMFSAFQDHSRAAALAGLTNRQTAATNLGAIETSTNAANTQAFNLQSDVEQKRGLQQERAGKVGTMQANVGIENVGLDKKHALGNALMDASVGVLGMASAGGVKNMFSMDDLKLGAGGPGLGSPTPKVDYGNLSAPKLEYGNLLDNLGNRGGLAGLHDNAKAHAKARGYATGGKVEESLYNLSDYDTGPKDAVPENKAKTAFAAMLKQLQKEKSMANGGKLSYEDGGEVMETPGEFSHEENPIDMIDGDGDKVGEVTGGELVFNPEQSSIIEELVSLGDEDSLMQYLKDLMNEPQFQDAI